MRGIVWFREDLRINDNPALFNASRDCHDGIIGVFIIDSSMWHEHNVAACRVDFILRGLTELNHELSKLNIPLIIIEVRSTKDIPQVLHKLTEEFKVQALFFNRQYEVNEKKRDLLVINYLKQKNISCSVYDDQIIFLPDDLKTQQGSYYKVFTSFKNAWYQRFHRQERMKLLPKPKSQQPLNITSSSIPNKITGFNSTIDPNLWPAGENSAAKQLKFFIKNNLHDYAKCRDFPSLDCTSKLSPYLSAGMISVKTCFHAALIANNDEIESGGKGAGTWISELIWREFYKYILIVFPRISMNKAYKIETEKLHWHYDEKKFKCWQQGLTGYPIIDAAMRQLNTTGWMHNRLRMVTAMFLAKNLFFDWRLGEKYFITNLIDGDLAANNGNWQWCASTGVDAVPYFRIFNPIRQSERFDPQGNFIRKFCPELNEFDDYAIHHPEARNPSLAFKVNYPSPIVDLEKSRQYAINAHRALGKVT